MIIRTYINMYKMAKGKKKHLINLQFVLPPVVSMDGSDDMCDSASLPKSKSAGIELVYQIL